MLDIAITDDNARFASVGGDRQVFLWDVTQGKTLRRWVGHAGRVNTVDFGGEGSVVVSGALLSFTIDACSRFRFAGTRKRD